MYEVFIYNDKTNQLHGDYLGIVYLDSIPSVGSIFGEYRVAETSDIFGIYDVILERI